MSRKILLIIVGAGVLLLVIIGVCVFAILPAITQASAAATATPTPAATPSITTTPKRAATNIYAPYLKLYGFNIENQIAQGLHLSVDQLTQQLSAGKTLSDIATAQGVSSAQLQSLAANAVQSAFQPVVNSGALTQQQVARLVKRVQKNPNVLDNILLHVKAPAS